MANNTSGNNRKINILHLNANDISNKKKYLKNFLTRNDIHLALIHESKLRNESKTPTFSGYSPLRRDQASGDGSVILALISKSIPFTNTTVQTIAALLQESTLEIQSIKERINKSDFFLHNIYVPPASSSLPGYQPDIINPTAQTIQ